MRTPVDIAGLLKRIASFKAELGIQPPPVRVWQAIPGRAGLFELTKAGSTLLSKCCINWSGSMGQVNEDMKGSMVKSEFMGWFVDQHKARTLSGMKNHSDQQLRDMVQTGRVADQVLACRELWDEKHQSALYAWQASNKTPKATMPGSSENLT